jgi:hypothetical protein
MSDPLAERLRKLAARENEELTNQEKQARLQQRVFSYIATNARSEHEKLLEQLVKRVGEVNPQIDELPKSE